MRAHLSKVFYGDQGIFVRREVFEEVGGFEEVPIFEDVLFSRKLKGRGPVSVLPAKLRASPRRWKSQGVVKATLVNWAVTLGFLLKVPAARLARAYRQVR